MEEKSDVSKLVDVAYKLTDVCVKQRKDIDCFAEYHGELINELDKAKKSEENLRKLCFALRVEPDVEDPVNASSPEEDKPLLVFHLGSPGPHVVLFGGKEIMIEDWILELANKIKAERRASNGKH